MGLGAIIPRFSRYGRKRSVLQASPSINQPTIQSSNQYQQPRMLSSKEAIGHIKKSVREPLFTFRQYPSIEMIDGSRCHQPPVVQVRKNMARSVGQPINQSPHHAVKQSISGAQSAFQQTSPWKHSEISYTAMIHIPAVPQHGNH